MSFITFVHEPLHPKGNNASGGGGTRDFND
jgi:hypothetical protein